MSADLLTVVGLCSILALVFIGLWAVCWLAVRLSPRFEKYLDEQWVAPWRQW